MRIVSTSALLLLVSCAGARSTPEELPEAPAGVPAALGPTASGSVAPGGKSTFNAKVWVGWQDGAADCEQAARDLRESSPDDAWQALKACIEMGRFKRGPFTQLNLLTGEWQHELKTRPDAVRVLARVIANRGGDVDGDISRVQAIRMPVFTLKAALSQPDIYKGRWLIIRGRLTDVKQDARSATAMLDEMSMKATEMLRKSRYGYRERMEDDQGHYITWESEYGRRFEENVLNPTGRKVLGRLPEADPFLEPDNDFVFVGRFDGARIANDGKEQTKYAVVSVIGYYRPAALVVQ